MRPNAWRPLSPQTRTRWWLVYRFLPAAVLLTVLGLLLFLLFQPFWHPHVHLLFAAPHYRDARIDCSLPAEDLAAVQVPPTALLEGEKSRDNAQNAAEDPYASPDTLTTALQRAGGSEIREGDVLIVWLGGEIVSRDGRLDLLCEDFDPSDLQSGCLPLAQVFERLKASPAATKLLILDTGRVNHLPRLGTLAATYTQQITKLVEQSRDPDLWVVLSHGDLERSHVLADPRRSVLAHFAREALQGAADTNADRYVDVGEFYRYLRAQVSQFVARETLDRDAQTPQLLWGGGPLTAAAAYPVLMPVQSTQPAIPTLHAGAKDAKETKEATPPAEPHLSKPPAALLAIRPPGDTIDGSAGRPPASGAAAKPDATKAEAAKTAAPPEAAGGAKALADPVLAASPAELSVMAWSLHDRLAASASLRPIETAPQLWRAFQDVLIGHELALLAGDAKRLALLTPELRRLVRQANDLAAGAAPQRYRPHDLLPDLAAAAAPPTGIPAFSLAMAQRLALRGGEPVRPEAAAAGQRLTTLMAKSEPAAKAEFQKWLKDLPPGLDDYIEIHLARSLAARDDLSWDQIRLLLNVRRAAETAAAETLDAGEWSRLQIQRADALRRSADHLILQSVRQEDIQTGMTLLRQALTEYEQASLWNDDVIALEQDIDGALFDLPDYLRWSIVALANPAANGPDPALLSRLLDDLRQAIAVMDSPSATRLPEVRRLRRQIEDTLAKLRQSVDRALNIPPAMPDASPPRDIAPPSDGGLAAADLRRRLLALALGVPPADFRPIPSSRPSQDFDPARRLPPAVQRYFQALQLVLGDLLPGGHSGSAYKSGGDVRDLLQGLTGVIQRVTADNQDLSDPSQRPARLQRLKAVRRVMNLVDPWDVDHLEAASAARPAAASILRRARLYDLLVWQQQRLTAETGTAPPAEQQELAAAAEACRRAAAALSDQPAVEPNRLSQVTMDAPAQIDLADKAETEVLLTLVNGNDRRQEIWLAADYDPAVLEVAVRDEDRLVLYQESSVHLQAAVLAGPMSVPLANPPSPGSPSTWTTAYLQPGKTSLAGLPPTCALRANESRGIWIRLRRKSLAGGDARVVFRAIAAPASEATSGPPIANQPFLIRHDLIVQLPRRLPVDLVVEGIADTWHSTETGLALYPFPNHSTAYRFFLTNTAAVEREVSLDIYRTETPGASLPPRGDVPAAIAKEYLSRVGAGVPLAHIDKIMLPANGERLAVPFPPPGKAAKPEGAPKPDEAAKPAAGPPEPPALSPVLAVVITDHASNRQAVRKVDILTQRPARYLRAAAEYDPLRRRVEFVFRPMKPSALPADGVRIVAEPDVQETQDLYHADALLRQGAEETLLHVEVPRDMTEIYPIIVQVDGFARAFRYEVATRSSTITPLAEMSRAAIRITKPKAGALYGPATTEVPVDLQVDVPRGLLLDDSNCVEVGIDTNRDRELDHKETVRLTSDRQVDLLAEEIGPDGRFVIRTRVTDLKVKLKPPARRALRANLLARILMPASIVWSDPLEVVFDNRPPLLSQLQMNPGAQVTAGEDLQVSVLATDNELSGVAKVEAAFDLQRKGEFGTPPPVEGSMQTDGRWVVVLPTKPLKPGLQTVLVRASDRCDNASEYLKATVEIVPKDSEGPKKVLGHVTGRVVYGKFEKQPVPEALVQLTIANGPSRETKTDAAGQFVFLDVPPGDYKLASEKLLGGNRRSGHVDVKVPAPPQFAPAAEITLATARGK
jgi:hypothetical protein